MDYPAVRHMLHDIFQNYYSDLMNWKTTSALKEISTENELETVNYYIDIIFISEVESLKYHSAWGSP